MSNKLYLILILLYFDPEDKGSMYFRNVGINDHFHTAH
jgi:hypothetical protein